MKSQFSGRTVGRYFAHWKTSDTAIGTLAGIIIGTFILLVALAVLMALASTFWGPAIGLVASMIIANFRWQEVRFSYYVRSLRAAWPIAALLCGWGVQEVLGPFLSGAATSIPWMLGGGLVAAGTLAFMIMVFEGKLMSSIFDLVPQEQQAELQSFVNNQANTKGQQVDFSQLDQQAVVGTIKERVIGQDAIVDAVVTTSFRRARLRRPHKPVGVFLFVGATGAGKTELAKALADQLFDGRIVRVDCNELSQPHNVARLIGAPPGYIGSEQGGQLCRDIGRIGTGVLLLDEIEKADPSVLKTIMGLLDEARLTEQSTGDTYNATGFLIILTSNAAASEIAQVVASQKDQQAQAAGVKDALKQAGFLPEVLGRIDSIFPFGTLSRTAVVEIVGRFLLGFGRDTGVQIVKVDAALLVDLVTKQEKLADYGVREVVRLVENAVVDGLLNVKDQGYSKAAIKIADGQVRVEPVANG